MTVLTPSTNKPCIIVHGGAWAIPEHAKAAASDGVKRAALAGSAVLAKGGTSLDAVQAAVCVLEDDPVFDAGRGSCLNSKGQVEMDAVMMIDNADGPRSGAVAGISTVRNPVKLARHVLDDTPHCLLVGQGAEDFADEVGVERISTINDLVSDAAVEEWKNYGEYRDAVSDLFNRGGTVADYEKLGHDTVGAVALDGEGNLASATSTGGITFKRAGRVGDSPLIGSGLFCDRDVGACSTTGHGESIMKVTLARYALILMEMKGMSAEMAIEEALKKMRMKTGGCGGMIMIGKDGTVAHGFSTTSMAWASVGQDGKLESGIDA